jgi:hypothetical protein
MVSSQNNKPGSLSCLPGKSQSPSRRKIDMLHRNIPQNDR